MSAILSGFPVVGVPGDIHSSALNPLGTIVSGVDANGYYAEYVYLKGIGSTAVGSWVSYDELGITLLATANAQGALAVATAATVASTWGWYQIVGNVSALALTAFADNGKVYLTGTAGSVDDTDVAGDAVIGAIGRSAVNETTLLATFQIMRPFVMDLAVD